MTTSTAVDMLIRPFRGDDADYAALAALRNAVFPDYPFTAAEWRRMDDQRFKGHLFQRLFAEVDGQVVAMASYGHMSWIYHPQQFDLGVYVHPDHRRRGLGARLYERALAELAPHRPTLLRHQVREDFADSIRFAERRGYAEEMRVWESRLELARFDPDRFAGHVERVLGQGIAIRTAAELEAADPEFWAKLYELDVELGHDVPSPEPFTPPPFEHWIGWFKGSPAFLPAGFFVATDGDRYVGLSALWRRESAADLDTGLTGVRRDYRRRGIALALKLRAIEYARRAGAPMIRTDNASTNRPMLSINEALGFEKLPAWVTLRRVITAE